MKKVYQRTNTDCFAACLASILELDLNQVPAFDGNNQQLIYNEWLEKEHGLGIVFGNYFQLHANGLIPACYHIISGETSKGTWHARVAYQGIIVHDPWPEKLRPITGRRLKIGWLNFL